jgi:lysophospholipase L1-like esterase
MSREVRWPGRLQVALGTGWHVIEEGLNGRTTVLENPFLPGRNGLTYLQPCLESHAPLEFVLIYLGTSDLANRYAMTATDIARAVGRLATVVMRSGAGTQGRSPRPILLCPPPLGDTEWNEDWSEAPRKAAVLPERFRAVATSLDVPLIDLGEVAQYSALDGIHLDAANHEAVARLIERDLRRFAEP